MINICLEFLLIMVSLFFNNFFSLNHVQTADNALFAQRTDFKIKTTANGLSTGVQNIDWVNVPAGRFTYGQNNGSQVIKYNFKIMKYEVTNAQYVVFLKSALAESKVKIEDGKVRGYYPGDSKIAAGDQDFYIPGEGQKSAARIKYNGTDFIITPDASYGNHPVVYVTYYGARAFADYYGYRLPTEQEWEKAARGNTTSDYPWGNSITGKRANYTASGDPWDNGTTPVGYYNGQNGTINSPGPFGAYDMVGNVWEWTDSWYDSTYRVIRGGSWANSTYYLPVWSRSSSGPGGKNDSIGFRCVKTN